MGSVLWKVSLVMDISNQIRQLVIPHSGLAKEVIIIEWLVKHGANVIAGTPLVVYESEKSQVEMEAPCDGRLEILIQASSVEIGAGTVIGRIVSAE